MIDIKIDDEYLLQSDERNIILVKKSIAQSGKNAGKEMLINVGYYGNIQSALKYYKKIKKNTSNAKSFEELFEVIDEINKKIDEIDKKIEKTFKGN